MKFFNNNEKENLNVAPMEPPRATYKKLSKVSFEEVVLLQ
jgi:hypothetical protein